MNVVFDGADQVSRRLVLNIAFQSFVDFDLRGGSNLLFKNCDQFLIAVRMDGGNQLVGEDGETTSHLMGFFYRTIR